MATVFGEASVLNDGRRVTAPWGKPGIYVGDTFVDGPQLRMPDACLTPGGRVWVCGARQGGGLMVWSAQTGWNQIAPGPFGTRTIIRADGERCRVAWARTPTEWQCGAVDLTGTVDAVDTGPIPNGGGAAGMRDFDALGNPRPHAPLDTTFNGYPVRGDVGGLTKIACALPTLPDQIVLSRSGQIGTLQLAQIEWATLRLSPNGRWWVGTQFGTDPRMWGGGVPTTMPPLVTTEEPPVPPQPPGLPPKATIDHFVTPIQEGHPSRAVAKITQGTPTDKWQFRWQWESPRGSGHWHTGGTNPVSDDDHSFNRPNGTNDNVFPPGAQQVPIRLQTLVNGVKMDESSSTSRVIEVLASTPPEPPEPIPPPQPHPPTSGRIGIPRGNGFQVIDDTGGWLAWGTSWFWGAGAWLRERDRAQQNLNWTAGARIDFNRVIATGLKLGGTNCSVSPTDPKFQQTIAELTDAHRATGQRVQWVIFGGTSDAPTVADRRTAVDLVCEALQGRQSSVQLVEIANEGWQNGFPGDAGRDELRDLVARVRTHLPGTLVAPTCPQPGDDVTPEKIKYYYANSQATIQTHHYARSTQAPDGVWRPTRKPWRESHFAVDGCCLLVQNNEPRGPDSSGSQTHDPLVLALDAATTWQCGVGAYVLHTGAGVFGRFDPGHPDRPSNLWETTGIEAICSAIRTTRSLLPTDLANFSKHQATASTNPFTFVDVPAEQFTSAYAATAGPAGAGQRIVQPVCGIVRDTAFTLRSGTCTGRVYHPVTGQVLEVFDRTYHATVAQPGILVIATRT